MPQLPHWLTHSQTLKDSATQLLIKYKSGAIVTQLSLLNLRIFQIYKLNPAGEMTWPSGDQYIGDWENNQRLEYGKQSIYLEISRNAAQHFVATFDWKKICRSGHGLYLYSSGNRYKGQYVAGRKVNLYFLSHNCFGILLAALRMVFRIVIQAIFRRVLVSFGGRLGYTQGRSLSANLSLRKGKKALLLFEKMWTNYCFV